MEVCNEAVLTLARKPSQQLYLRALQTATNHLLLLCRVSITTREAVAPDCYTLLIRCASSPVQAPPGQAQTLPSSYTSMPHTVPDTAEVITELLLFFTWPHIDEEQGKAN